MPVNSVNSVSFRGVTPIIIKEGSVNRLLSVLELGANKPYCLKRQMPEPGLTGERIDGFIGRLIKQGKDLYILYTGRHAKAYKEGIRKLYVDHATVRIGDGHTKTDAKQMKELVNRINKK